MWIYIIEMGNVEKFFVWELVILDSYRFSDYCCNIISFYVKFEFVIEMFMFKFFRGIWWKILEWDFGDDGLL